MMDRNLGATTATPGDVGALGLFYQWGRKDPFLGSSSISSSIKALSTNNSAWTTAGSDASIGTIEYAIVHPATFIKRNSINEDWYYTGSSTTDNTRWQSSKTIYDPCPPGYRVPDGGDNGVWSKAFGTSISFKEDAFDSTNKGFNLGSSGDCTKHLTSSTICWYPATGYLSRFDGKLTFVGVHCYVWSCTPISNSYNAYTLYFRNDGHIESGGIDRRTEARSVRCLKE